MENSEEGRIISARKLQSEQEDRPPARGMREVKREPERLQKEHGHMSKEVMKDF